MSIIGRVVICSKGMTRAADARRYPSVQHKVLDFPPLALSHTRKPVLIQSTQPLELDVSNAFEARIWKSNRKAAQERTMRERFDILSITSSEDCVIFFHALI